MPPRLIARRLLVTAFSNLAETRRVVGDRLDRLSQLRRYRPCDGIEGRCDLLHIRRCRASGGCRASAGTDPAGALTAAHRILPKPHLSIARLIPMEEARRLCRSAHIAGASARPYRFPMSLSSLLVAGAMGYLLGSVPFGLLLTRLFGLGDI